jgi:Zinc carboxypeptidase
MSYLNHKDYGAALGMLAALRVNGQPFCWTFKVGTTYLRKPIYGLRIHGGRARPRRAVLIVGGAHAREMIPPEAVLLFAWKVCKSYVTGKGFSLGNKTYPAGIATLLVEALQLIVVPMLNPDGREWVETTDQNWRKNRRPGATCRGVDINRNYDFLFTSGLGTSTSPCNYEVYRGPSANSEWEVRAIRNLIDSSPNIRGILDVHSFRGSILYPWGDDQNQSTNSNMNFMNPAFDGQRGIKNDSYKEHIVSKDWRWYEETAIRMRDRVKEVAGRTYIAQQTIDLYGVGISANLVDYPYSLHLTNTARPKIMSMAVEIGFESDGRFWPSGAAAQTVRNEGAVLIVEFCLAMMCAGDAVLSSAAAVGSMADELRSMREELRESSAGRRYVEWSESLGGEIMLRLLDSAVARDISEVLKDFRKWWKRRDTALDDGAAQRTTRLLLNLRKRGSREFKNAINAAIADVERMKGKPASATVSVIRARASK